MHWPSLSSQAAQAAERTPHPATMALAALAARRIGLGRAWQARDTEAASWCPPWRHVALRRSVLTHAADGDARPWTQLLEEVALAFSAEDVQAMLGRKVGSRSHGNPSLSHHAGARGSALGFPSSTPFPLSAHELMRCTWTRPMRTTTNHRACAACRHLAMRRTAQQLSSPRLPRRLNASRAGSALLPRRGRQSWRRSGARLP